MKRVITKAVYDALSDVMKAEYEAGTNAEEFVLKLEDYEDPGELRRARDREKEDARKAKEAEKKAKDELEELKRTGSRNTGDIAALEQSWRAAAEQREAAAKKITDARTKQLKKVLRDDVAASLARELSGENSALMLPHVVRRLDVDIPEEGEPATRVLDDAGKPSALTVAELATQLRTDKRFAAIILASKASGGGAAGNQGSGGTKEPKDYTGAERTALFKSNRAEHDRLFPPKL